MTEKSESRKFETLVEEADELMRQINSDFVGNMQEEHHRQLELQAQNLKKLKKTKSEMDATDAEKSSKINAGAEGIHEAIEDVIKAMKHLKNKIL